MTRPEFVGNPEKEASGLAESLAALSICESLLISFVERGLLDGRELEEILESARETNLKAESDSAGAKAHAEAALLLRRILVRCQSIRPENRS